LREFRNIRPFNGIDHSGPRLRCKQTENAGAGAYVEHRAAWCHSVDNGSAKRLAPDRISQHRLMTPEIAVIDFKWHLSSLSMANAANQPRGFFASAEFAMLADFTFPLYY
jgi:hypothetical protein